jgi:hypothetical protein
MKYLVIVAMMGLGLYGLTPAGISAGSEPTRAFEHHNTQHSLGPCGDIGCPK